MKQPAQGHPRSLTNVGLSFSEINYLWSLLQGLNYAEERGTPTSLPLWRTLRQLFLAGFEAQQDDLAQHWWESRSWFNRNFSTLNYSCPNNSSTVFRSSIFGLFLPFLLGFKFKFGSNTSKNLCLLVDLETPDQQEGSLMRVVRREKPIGFMMDMALELVAFGGDVYLPQGLHDIILGGSPPKPYKGMSGGDIKWEYFFSQGCC